MPEFTDGWESEDNKEIKSTERWRNQEAVWRRMYRESGGAIDPCFQRTKLTPYAYKNELEDIVRRGIKEILKKTSHLVKELPKDLPIETTLEEYMKSMDVNDLDVYLEIGR